MMSRRSVVSTGLLAAAAVAGTGLTTRVRARTAEETHPPLGDFVRVDGVPVHYLRRGRGPEIVLIHGAGGNLRDFAFDFFDRLVEAGFTVTAFDRPGLGYSGRLPGYGPLSLDAEGPLAQGRHLRRAAGMLGIGAPILVGHSFGGIVSLGWAMSDLDSTSPAAARGYVSLAGVAMPWPGELGLYYRLNGGPLGAVTTPLVSAFVPGRVVADRIEDTFAPQPAPQGYADFIGARLTLRPTTFRANVRQVNTLRPHVVAMARRYPELRLPIELVHGTADRTVPIEVHSRPLADLVDGAALRELDGIGHMPHHVAPDACLAAIRRAHARAGD
ncbi:pimeloyl-ACP methyl ester carboxylesterase [Hasllibacter halocynthiae]|uniref:Pimeloyl-ACP methyl ester carboxylesterase n=1 Tax=Hasllibacter halocynthiae TaxID=595589 RepID=A0A2T0X8B7_9RHOB|nr:alpha/beta hydrolase [Hasllibacter halocynthiae]PRY95188.1 pimeloyl-ACP methyl ester carboxylesterase [Hasllibacter halocynthiae]